MTKRALIIGASGGIGAAVARQLAQDGWQVDPLSRRADGFDITDQASVDAHLGACDGPYDLVFIATGILAANGKTPEKALAQAEQTNFQAVFAANALGPAYVLAHVPRLLAKSHRSHVGLLTARVGSIGDNRIGGWHSYRASKAAANQLLRGAAIELGRSHKNAVAVALHPGTVETDFTKDYAARHATVSAEACAQNLLRVLLGLTPQESGGFYDYAGKPVDW